MTGADRKSRHRRRGLFVVLAGLLFVIGIFVSALFLRTERPVSSHGEKNVSPGPAGKLSEDALSSRKPAEDVGVLETAAEEANGVAKMRWFNLKFTGAELTLISSTTKPGAVKRRRVIRTEDAIYYRVVDANGGLLWEGSERDPRVLHYDYDVADEANAGEPRLGGGRIVLPEAEFAVRIPELDGAALLEVMDYSSEPSGRLLGTFAIGER